MNQSRVKFWALAALFAAPLSGAALVYFVFPGMMPGGRLNHGALIEPARPLPALALHDAAGGAISQDALKVLWSVVYLGGAECAQACRARLMLTRQVRLALDKHQRRVQRVYLAPDAQAAAVARSVLAAEHPDMKFFVDTGAQAAAFFKPDDAQDLFLLDPLANWLMVYRGPLEHKELYRDLKRLLRFSQIG